MKTLEEHIDELKTNGMSEEDAENYYAAMQDEISIFDYTHR